MELEGLVPRDVVALVVVDLQEKLFPRVHQYQQVMENCVKTIEFCKRLKLPMVVTEQYPSGLGVTVPEIQAALGEFYKPIPKTAFSCFGEPAFVDAVNDLGVDTLVLIGIETHVCVAQTALVGMNAHDYDMMVLADCLSARDPFNHTQGLERLRDEGALVSTMEMFFYEMLVAAKTPEHKSVFDLLK